MFMPCAVACRVLSIRSSAHSGVKVHMQRCPAPDAVSKYNGIVTDVKWQNINSAFEEISLDRIEGDNFAAKLEMFMTCTVANNAP